MNSNESNNACEATRHQQFKVELTLLEFLSPDQQHKMSDRNFKVACSKIF